MSRKLLVAALALAAALAGIPSGASASDVPVRPVAVYDTSQVQTTALTAAQAMQLGEQSTGIGPGSHLLMTMDEDPGSTYGCTASYVFASGADLLLGAAGHCFLPGDRVSTHGDDADYDPAGTHVEVCVADCTNGGLSGFVITGRTVELGEVVYARQADGPGADAEQLGFDFGLVRIPAELHDLVRLTMPVFGGPVTAHGELLPGDVTCHFGHALGFGEVWPTQGRVGTGLFEDEGVWFAAAPSLMGDSGSAVQTCVPSDGGLTGDAAIGTLTHLTSIGVAGTTIEKGIELAREAGLSITLLLAGAGAPGGEEPPAGEEPAATGKGNGGGKDKDKGGKGRRS